MIEGDGQAISIAYSTYALQSVDPFKAVARVSEIGYDGLEINCGPDWPTEPRRFDAEDRKKLVDAFRQVGFAPPPVMNLIGLCAHDENIALKEGVFAATCRLARDLCWLDQPSVVTTTLGPQVAPWELVREDIAERLWPYVNLAADHDVILAAEAHVGQEMDNPEKARWLVEQIDHPNLRLNFDCSHFLVKGIDLQHAFSLNAGYAVHAHIKDGRMIDGEVVFALPGDDQLDLRDYLKQVEQSGWDFPITIEVSGQIWQAENYGPWTTATHCFEKMDAARRAI